MKVGDKVYVAEPRYMRDDRASWAHITPLLVGGPCEVLVVGINEIVVMGTVGDLAKVPTGYYDVDRRRLQQKFEANAEEYRLGDLVAYVQGHEVYQGIIHKINNASVRLLGGGPGAEVRVIKENLCLIAREA